MKKQLILLLVCVAVAAPVIAGGDPVPSVNPVPPSLTVDIPQPTSPATPSYDAFSSPITPPAATLTPTKSCCSLNWVKNKAHDVWGWTQEKAMIVKGYLADKYAVAKQFTADHKQAVIITSAVAATVITAVTIYHLIKKHNAKKAKRTRVLLEVVQ
jgi:hypothetical protein